MKRSAAIVRLRELASIGLPAESFIPAFLEGLHALIPSHRNLFDWTDCHGRLIRYYFEGSIDQEISRQYFEKFHNQLEREVMPTFLEAVTGHAVVQGAEALERPEFFRSALYNEIWRPQGLHSRIEAIVHGGKRRPLGSLVLYRAPGEKRFDKSDEELLARMVPYVAKGLEGSPMNAQVREYVEFGDPPALLTLGIDGAIGHQSPEALKLLLLSHGGITPDSMCRSPRRQDFPALDALWGQFVRAPALGSASLRVTLENAWGRFVFEGRAMGRVDASKASETSILLVSIQRHEPRSVAIRRALDGLEIPPAQREVCMLLVAGESQRFIAKQMGIAPATVADHIRKMYKSLDVHSVHELVGLVHRRNGAL